MYTTLITTADLANHHADPNWILCDCRFDLNNPNKGHADYRDGHIPHAVYVDLDHDLSSPPSGKNGRHPLPSIDELTAHIESLGIQNDSQVIVYDDDGGSYAVRLWWILRYLGHQAVAVLDGGIQAWIEAGFDLSREAEQRPLSHYRVNVQTDRLVTIDQLLEAPLGREILLLDARSSGRYRGEDEPYDPVAGHIPGAENRFWRNNLNPRGFFKTTRELKSELDLLLRGRFADNAIIYCGSGVTSCHNILAFIHAGYDMPRLYAGAWSEWCSDIARGVETGDPEIPH